MHPEVPPRSLGKGTRDVRVSVVIPCHNNAAYIEGAVESVWGQTARASIAEIVIVDDGSTDGSRAIIHALAERAGAASSVPHIIPIFHETNKGASAARNSGINRSTGTHIATLDADDTWLPEKLAHQLSVLEAYPEAGMVYTDFVRVYVDGNSEVVRARSLRGRGREVLREYFVYDAPMMTSTQLFSAAAVLDLKGYDERLWVGEDTDLNLRLVSRFSVHHVPEPLVRKRLREGSLGQQIEMNFQEYLATTDRYASEHPALAPYARLRTARLYTSLGRAYLAHGRRQNARAALLKALALDAWSLRSLLLLIASFAPASYGEQLIRLFRRLRHRLPRR